MDFSDCIIKKGRKKIMGKRYTRSHEKKLIEFIKENWDLGLDLVAEKLNGMGEKNANDSPWNRDSVYQFVRTRKIKAMIDKMDDDNNPDSIVDTIFGNHNLNDNQKFQMIKAMWMNKSK